MIQAPNMVPVEKLVDKDGYLTKSGRLFLEQMLQVMQEAHPITDNSYI